MICGRLPFQGGNQAAIVHSILFEEPRELAAPAHVQSIIAKPAEGPR
jgi:hypothetical protein